jgi:hypothetical protein
MVRETFGTLKDDVSAILVGHGSLRVSQRCSGRAC